MTARRPKVAAPGAEGRARCATQAGPKTPAIGRATLREHRGAWSVRVLHPPTLLPDAALMTRAEIPKVCGGRGGYCLLISTCDRIDEAQTDAEVSKRGRSQGCGDTIDCKSERPKPILPPAATARFTTTR
jgi:hypothetical protein